MRALVLNDQGKTDEARSMLRGAQQLALADRWNDQEEISRWVEVAEAAIDLPPIDPDAVTLQQRVWKFDTQRMLHANIQPLADALTTDAVYQLRRSETDEKYVLTVPRDRWIECDRIWNGGSRMGVHIIRSSVDVDLDAEDPVVTSHYAFEIARMFFTYVQKDTFVREEEVPASEWKLNKRVARVTKWFVGGETYDVENEGWDRLDQLVKDAKENGGTRNHVKALSLAGRNEEAFEVATSLREQATSAIELATVFEAAYAAFQPDVLKEVAKEAIELDPMVGTVPTLRRIAAEQLSPEKPSVLRDGIAVRPPSFFRKANVQLLAGGPTGVVVWQPTQDSIVGIYAHKGQTIESFGKILLDSRSGALKAQLLQSSDGTVDGFPAKHYVHIGAGIGRALAGQGKPTMQRFVLVQRSDDLIAIIVSAYADEFVFRDSEFMYFLETIKLR